VQVPTINVLARMVRIETALGVGTAFTGEHRDRQFLFTARHVVGDDDPVDAKLAVYDGRVVETSLTRVPGIPDQVDMAVFLLAEPLTPTHPMLLDSTGVMLGQDVWFLGYAYGMSFTAPGIGFLPLVKRATLSAIHPEEARRSSTSMASTTLASRVARWSSSGRTPTTYRSHP
jgi:hypothetical protein